MQLLISDANILIDMEEGGLLSAMFQLPFEYCVPDILFHEELAERHSHLLAAGLLLKELSGESVLRMVDLAVKYNGPSRIDFSALALSEQDNCPLLTGDAQLRKAASAEGAEVRGTLWLVEQLVVKKVITKAAARQSYAQMQAAGSRLPWKKAAQRLAAL